MTTTGQSLVERARLTDAEIQGAHDFMEEDEDGNRSIVCDIANRQIAKVFYTVLDWLDQENKKALGDGLDLPMACNRLLAELVLAGLTRPEP